MEEKGEKINTKKWGKSQIERKKMKILDESGGFTRGNTGGERRETSRLRRLGFRFFLPIYVRVKPTGLWAEVQIVANCYRVGSIFNGLGRVCVQISLIIMYKLGCFI